MLPKKLHEALRLALDDLAKAERDPRFKIYMGAWCFQETGSPYCKVCLAGSVMALSMNLTPVANYKSDMPEGVSSEDEPMFRALDQLRFGCVSSACYYARIDSDGESLDRDITRYSDDPEAWRSDMEKLYQDLKAADL